MINSNIPFLEEMEYLKQKKQFFDILIYTLLKNSF